MTQDTEMAYIMRNNCIDYMNTVNELLKQGGWRVAHVFIAEENNIYNACLIRSESCVNTEALEKNK